MAGITMCAGHGCPSKELCRRHTETPSPDHQSYSGFWSLLSEQDIACSYFLANDEPTADNVIPPEPSDE